MATYTVNLGNLLLSLSDAVDLANSSIAQHQERTAYIALEIAKNADLPEQVTSNIFIAALLHDAGAITVEEKTFLHHFDPVDLNKHCVRGEVLLNRIPDFAEIAPIVKYHHTEWSEWDQPLDTLHVYSSQIVLLADYIERLIDRNRYILHHRDDIIRQVGSISGTMVHPRIVEYFLKVSRMEAFWLDLISPRLYSLLFSKSPLRNIEIDFYKLEHISKLFRDIIDFKSPFTATHTSGVSACAEMISRLFGFSEHEILEMKIAGNFHDLGKLAIPNSILEKPDSLTLEEFDIIKSHSYHSYHVIKSIPGLNHIAEWAGFHHEKLDGTGYPFKNDEQRLTIGARIMAAADVFTAIAEDRPYRKGMAKDEIIKVLNNMVKQKMLDRTVVAVMLDNYESINAHVKIIQEAAQNFYDARLRVI